VTDHQKKWPFTKRNGNFKSTFVSARPQAAAVHEPLGLPRFTGKDEKKRDSLECYLPYLLESKKPQGLP
jgi:hypothetical protein